MLSNTLKQILADQPNNPTVSTAQILYVTLNCLFATNLKYLGKKNKLSSWVLQQFASLGGILSPQF